jgi:hypothetical protein
VFGVVGAPAQAALDDDAHAESAANHDGTLVSRHACPPEPMASGEARLISSPRTSNPTLELLAHG